MFNPTIRNDAERRRSRRAVGAVAAVLALAACGSSGTSTTRSPTKASTASTACTTKATLDPSNFVDPTLSTNPYHPTKPAQQWVRSGTTEVGQRVVPHEIITTMTDVIRPIDGVPTIAMLDEETDAGEVSQESIDYMALDTQGNVWILGGYTEEFEGGQYTNTEDAWLGTAKGNRVGVLEPRDVTMSTPTWCIGGHPHEDPSVGIPRKVDAHVCVKFGCYDHVRVVTEGPSSAPDNEDKYYAPGVGVIDNIPLDKSLHQDRFQLTNLVELSPEGLAEKSQTVLDLEAHARTATSPKVFGAAPVGQRAS